MAPKSRWQHGTRSCTCLLITGISHTYLISSLAWTSPWRMFGASPWVQWCSAGCAVFQIVSAAALLSSPWWSCHGFLSCLSSQAQPSAACIEYALHEIRVYQLPTIKLVVWCKCNTVEPPIKDPPRKGKPPYKGHSSGPLSHSSSTFFYLREKDNLPTEDKVADPKVSFIRRFHYTYKLVGFSQ